MTAFWVLLAFVLGVLMGWTFAHKTVAIECDRLGGFFVGDKVYRCVLSEGDDLGQKTERKAT